MVNATGVALLDPGGMSYIREMHHMHPFNSFSLEKTGGGMRFVFQCRFSPHTGYQVVLLMCPHYTSCAPLPPIHQDADPSHHFGGLLNVRFSGDF